MDIGDVIRYYERTVRDMATVSDYLPSIDKARYIERIDRLTKMILKTTDKEGYNNGWKHLIKTKENLRAGLISLTPGSVKSIDNRNFLYNKTNNYFRVVGWFIYKKLGYPVPDSPKEWMLEKGEKEKEGKEGEKSAPPDLMGISGMDFGGGESFPD